MEIRKRFASKLRHKIEFIENIAEDDSVAENWVVAKEAYAEIAPISENNIKEFDNVMFGHIISEEYFIFTTRYLRNISYKMRIRFGHRIFAIRRVINPLENNIMLKTLALEITEEV